MCGTFQPQRRVKFTLDGECYGSSQQSCADSGLGDTSDGGPPLGPAMAYRPGGITGAAMELGSGPAGSGGGAEHGPGLPGGGGGCCYYQLTPLTDEGHERSTPDGSIGEIEHLEHGCTAPMLPKDLPDVTVIASRCTSDCQRYGHSDLCWMPPEPETALLLDKSMPAAPTQHVPISRARLPAVNAVPLSAAAVASNPNAADLGTNARGVQHPAPPFSTFMGPTRERASSRTPTPAVSPTSANTAPSVPAAAAAAAATGPSDEHAPQGNLWEDRNRNHLLLRQAAYAAGLGGGPGIGMAAFRQLSDGDGGKEKESIPLTATGSSQPPPATPGSGGNSSSSANPATKYKQATVSIAPYSREHYL